MALAGLVKAGIVDSRAVTIPATLLRALSDPDRAVRLRNERAEREAEARAYATRPEVVAAEREREVQKLRSTLADWASEPKHPKAVEARQRLDELEAEADAA